MENIEIVPSASSLRQSLRGSGYSPETALADLVGNSVAVAASAMNIEPDWYAGDSSVAVLDDGRSGLKPRMTLRGQRRTTVVERRDNDINVPEMSDALAEGALRRTA